MSEKSLPDWKDSRIKEETEKLMIYVYDNGSIPYRKSYCRLRFSLGISWQAAKSIVDSGIDAGYLEKRGEEVIVTPDGIQLILPLLNLRRRILPEPESH